MDESPIPQRLSPAAAPQPGRYSPVATWAKAALATAGLVCVIGGAAYFNSGPPPIADKRADDVSEAQQRERQKAFAALPAIRLSTVPAYDVPAAVDGMALAANAKQALLSELQQALLEPAPAPAAPAESAVPAATPSPTPRAQQAPAPQPAAKVPPPLRLAWITLWDTDSQDGDIVQIDSRGYSRTIVLTKEPVTFAVPVPANGVVSITGMRDGEGGGITVGLASGASRAVFPIMSTGQQLGLRVTVN